MIDAQVKVFILSHKKSGRAEMVNQESVNPSEKQKNAPI